MSLSPMITKEMHRAVNLTKVNGVNGVDAAENSERSERPTFQKNEPVEIYGPTSTLAFPAIVDSVTYDEKYINVMTDYDVNGLASLPIQASYVHRYETYPVGTRAMCGRGRRKFRGSDKSQVPCLVKSRISGKFRGFEYADTYGVVYLDGFASEVNIDHLPFSRVQR
ncbi:hypothetical protein THAOC_02085 [Thalassiosira oceanica]|uniref:Uncharacterized protein n=1 Tax=Thalassiosira oceanica TaxID=159749 RepID=K0TMF7_THAOC|nr:hypothetical protein THAOC_02085 [Thalassiosira oceanica]|eukprot:EJK76171.1 hypothetical protein THAOC_02085 [Thalassiosira oceanica]